jgi:primosomal protein N' (replication factor Y)
MASARRAEVLASRLARAGGNVALLPGGWPEARAGAAVVVGSRKAVWAPCPGLTSIVVLDGHEESLVQEQTPTWSAVHVAVERARRCDARCVIASPCPTPEIAALGTVVTVDRAEERAGWAMVEVVDRRTDDPRLGLYSERLVQVIRSEARALLVLNRTGRARLLSCTSCGELIRCERCQGVMAEGGDGLICWRCHTSRPRMCSMCDSTRLSTLRVGVTRAREELEALAGRPVAEVSAATRDLPDAELVIGTEAALHRYGPGDGYRTVAFVDFDQELLAPRVKAPEEALALLALASRLVRGRQGRTIVQTRLPTHPVLRSAVMADPSLLLADELELRRSLDLPPFSAVALVSGEDAGSFVEEVRRSAAGKARVSGPDRGTWMVKSADPPTLADALAVVPRSGRKVRVAVDPARF